MRLFLRAEVPGKEDAGLGPFMVNRSTGPLGEEEDEAAGQLRKEPEKGASASSLQPSVGDGEIEQDDL